MESNNIILNNENFINTFQHFPNNMAMELNSLISLNNTHINHTDHNLRYYINNSNTNNYENFSIQSNNHQRSNNNSLHQNEPINYSTITLSQQMNLSLDNNKNKEEEEEEEEELIEQIEGNEENNNSSEMINENENNNNEITNNSLPEFDYENILQQNMNENENVTLLNTFSNRNNINTFSNFHPSNTNINQQQENTSNSNGYSNTIINKNEDNHNIESIKFNTNKEDNKENEKIKLKLDFISISSQNKNKNNLEKFMKSPQYSDLQKTYLYANKIYSLKGENNFDIGTDEGNEICQEFLNQIEVLMKSMNIKGQDRNYRKKFTKAYFLLFEENKLCFLSEIFDSAQENTSFIVVNEEKYYFTEEVLNYGNDLFVSFCALITLLIDSIKMIKDKVISFDINKILDNIHSCLIDFDMKWVRYEEKYINELIIIEEKARNLITEGIKLENEITQYENKSKIKGKLLINDKKYNELRTKLIANILKINQIANINGKGRSDLPPEILFKAEKVLVTVSENKSKGMRNLAFKIKNALYVIRQLFRKYSKNIEGVDPRLSNNKDLSKYLLYFETKFELGMIYLLDNQKYNQLLSFSQIIEIICEKYNKYSIRDLIENNDPCIFVSLPSILLLKAMNKEDQNICKEYIPGLYDKNNESGKLFYNIKNLKKQVRNIIGDSNKTYNIIEKYILFDGTDEQKIIEQEIEQYSQIKKLICEIKKGLTNLSVHLQTYKPTQWNQFFQLAMDIKILNQNEMFNDANKSISVYDNNYNENDNENENDLDENDENNNESINTMNNTDIELF